jgi:cell division protein FtsL
MQVNSECIPEDVLIAFHENKLTPDERNNVVNHLESCVTCTRLWKEMDLFMQKPINNIPEKFKTETYKTLAPKPAMAKSNIINLSFLAYAAIIVVIILTGFAIFTKNQLSQTTHELSLQVTKLDSLKKENSILSNDLKSVRQSLATDEKIVQLAKNPVSQVPLYDLFPEGENQRGPANRSILKMKHDENKPLHVILNTTGSSDKPCTIVLRDSSRKAIWSSEIPDVKNGSISFMMPANFLSPGSYSIEIKSTSSGFHALFNFIYE